MLNGDNCQEVAMYAAAHGYAVDVLDLAGAFIMDACDAEDGLVPVIQITA